MIRSLLYYFFIVIVAQISFAKDDEEMQMQILETRIFRESSTDLEPKVISDEILKLQKIYSKNDRVGVFKDLVKRLTELPTLLECDDESFTKLHFLESKQFNKNLERYIYDQRLKMSKNCDQILLPKFEAIVNGLDQSARTSVSKIGGHVQVPNGPRNILSGPLFPDRSLIHSIYQFLASKSKNIAEKRKISEGQFEFLYRSWILMSCENLSLEFNQIANFYIRNYLNHQTLYVCDEFSKGWTLIKQVCDNIITDDGSIARSVYELILLNSKQRQAYRNGPDATAVDGDQLKFHGRKGGFGHQFWSE